MRIATTGFAVGVAALLLSAGVAFAEGPGPKTGEGILRPAKMASTTMPRKEWAVTASTTKAKMEMEKQKVAQRLADIQDKKKQEMANKLSEQFDKFNATWTDKFAKELDQLDKILVRIQARAALAKTAGKDVSSTDTAVTTAKTAVVTARTAVAAQAAKSYIVTTSTLPSTATSTPSGQEKIMQALRQSFQTLHKGLFKDLFALRDGPMKDARKAVQAAAQTLGKIPGVDEVHASTTPTTNI
jgi:hypothetical protein